MRTFLLALMFLLCCPIMVFAEHTYTAEIVVDHDKVVEDLTDFPIVLDETVLPPEIFNSSGGAKIDGCDIRFSSDEGFTEELAFEIVQFNRSSSTAQIWVKTDIFSASNTSLYLHFNDSSLDCYASNETYGSENVWSNNFIAVYHLETKIADGSLNEYYDSTKHHNGGQGTDAPGFSTDCKFSGVCAFPDGVNDKIDLPLTNVYDDDTMTLSFWLKPDLDNTNREVFGVRKGAESDNWIRFFLVDSQDRLNIARKADGSLVDFNINYPALPDNKWSRLDVVYSSSADYIKAYINGTIRGNVTSGVNAWTGTYTEPVMFGRYNDFDTGDEFLGQADSLFFSNTTRSKGWLKTSYNNQEDPSSFAVSSFSAEPPVIDSSPAYLEFSRTPAKPGNNVTHSLSWRDENLSGYIFSFCRNYSVEDANCTGTFTNDSFTLFSDDNISYGHITMPDTEECVGWCFYANDSLGQQNDSCSNDLQTYCNSLPDLTDGTGIKRFSSVSEALTFFFFGGVWLVLFLAVFVIKGDFGGTIHLINFFQFILAFVLGLSLLKYSFMIGFSLIFVGVASFLGLALRDFAD